MNDDEEIFLTIPVEITWEAIEDEMYRNLMKLGIDEIPSREQTKDILNLFDDGIGFFRYMEDSLEHTKNERVWKWFEVAYLKTKLDEINEIMGVVE